MDDEYGRHQRLCDATSSDFLTLDEAVEASGLSREDITDLMPRILHPGVGYLFYAPAVAQTRSIASARKRGSPADVKFCESRAGANNRRQLEALLVNRHYFRVDRNRNVIEFPCRAQVLAFASLPFPPGGGR